MKGHLLIICTGLNDNIATRIYSFAAPLEKAANPKSLRSFVRTSPFFSEKKLRPQRSKSVDKGWDQQFLQYPLAAKEHWNYLFLTNSPSTSFTVGCPVLEELDNGLSICRMQIQNNKVDILLHWVVIPDLMLPVKLISSSPSANFLSSLAWLAKKADAPETPSARPAPPIPAFKKISWLHLLLKPFFVVCHMITPRLEWLPFVKERLTQFGHSFRQLFGVFFLSILYRVCSFQSQSCACLRLLTF